MPQQPANNQPNKKIDNGPFAPLDNHRDTEMGLYGEDPWRGAGPWKQGEDVAAQSAEGYDSYVRANGGT